MAKKEATQVEKEKEFEGDLGDDFVPENEPGGANLGGINFETDFDVDKEFKVTPLVPQGTYHGSVVDVIFNAEGQSIVWSVCLSNNGGVMNDGETPIDGSVHKVSNWLPRLGDENIPDKSGKSNKRQSKINMMKQFADNMKIKMGSAKEIAEAIINKEWIGLSVDVALKVREFEGRMSNEIARMVATAGM